jgi:NADH:ubiquinone oxidoreductase subunit C
LILWLKQHSLARYRQLIEMVLIDEPGKVLRFTLQYLLSSVKFNTRIAVKIQITDTEELLSLTSIFCSVAWLEREI